MALIEHTLFNTIDKVKTAIERLRAFEPKDRPYWLAFSGGKDSCVILELANMAGVNFEAHYNVTSVDPPELVRFVKKVHPEVSFDIPHDKNGKPVSMWTLLKSRSVPPTRIARYCCEKLKESSGSGTVTITGVRWAESQNRKNNQGLVTVFHKGKNKPQELIEAGAKEAQRRGLILNDDNDEARRAVEVCFRTHKTMVNPIIDWLDEDVWEFIHKYNVPYCKLYDEGATRLGCIGCPLGGKKSMQEELDKYPKYKDEYMRCFEVMAKNRKERNLENWFGWETAQDIMNWWIRFDEIKDYRQLSMLETEEEP